MRNENVFLIKILLQILHLEHKEDVTMYEQIQAKRYTVSNKYIYVQRDHSSMPEVKYNINFIP